MSSRNERTSRGSNPLRTIVNELREISVGEILDDEILCRFSAILSAYDPEEALA